MIHDIFHVGLAVDDAHGLPFDEIHAVAATRAFAFAVGLAFQDHRLQVARRLDDTLRLRRGRRCS